MKKTITKLYDKYDDASATVKALEAIGVPGSDISILSHQSGHSGVAEDAGKGAGAGAILGGVGGLLAGLGVLAIPGLGPVVAAGWLAASVAGAGAGAIVGGAIGGIVGAMQKEGVSEEDAHVIAEGIRRGGSVVSAKVDNDLAPEALLVMNRHRSVDPAVRGRMYRESGWSRFDENAEPYSRDQIIDEQARHGQSDKTI